MREQLEGSRAVAEAVIRCRPGVVCAYPITPQTHIVEALGVAVRTGALAPCTFLNAESELAALSALIGASVAGSRAYTATASQGLLYMAEAVYNAAGLELPLVMTVANRAIGAPINIWNDHSDAMALRDAGWVQLYAADTQEAVDLHLLAFRLAEAVSLPVMVCMDGFVLTHAVEEVDVPARGAVDRFLPPRPLGGRQVLDPGHPATIGTMVGPDAYTEVRFLAHRRMLRVLDVLPHLAADLEVVTGCRLGLVRPYRLDGAETMVVAQGSVLGTLAEVVDSLRDEGVAVGSLGITAFRPFPDDEVAAALAAARRVVVVDRALAPSRGGLLAAEVARSVPPAVPVVDVVAGLGGRPITRGELRRCVLDAVAGSLPPLYLLGLHPEALADELTGMGAAGAGRP